MAFGKSWARDRRGRSVPKTIHKFIDADELASLFDDARPSGRGSYTALCPVHGDTRHSLSIWPSDRGTGLCCHAGCSRKEIARAVGIRESSLYADPPAPRRMGRAWR